MPAKPRTEDPQRLEAILDAAQAVFIREGYAAATTDGIAREARASKTTLYRLFGSKEALFQTLLSRRLSAGGTVAPLDPDAPADQVLRQLVLGVLAGVTAPDAIALVRIAIAEAVRFPALKAVMAQSLRYGAVTAWLESRRARGEMTFDDAEATAVMLIAMAQGDWTVRALYGLLDAPSPTEMAAHADRVAVMFLAAVSRVR